MAWVPVDRALLSHHKTFALAEALSIPEVYAVGHLVAFWTWAMDNAKDGVLRGPRRIIARAAEWTGEADTFIAALISSGFLDETNDALTIHDWDQYGGKLVEKHRKHADAMKESRAKSRAANTPEGTQEESQSSQVTCASRDTHMGSTCDTREEKRREEDKTPQPPAAGVRTQPAQLGRSVSQGRGGAPESKRDREAFIAATLKEYPHWRKEYERVIEDANPLEPDRYGAGVLRRWIDGDGTPRTPEQIREEERAKARANDPPRVKVDDPRRWTRAYDNLPPVTTPAGVPLS